jgi:hypothetical protein
VLAKFGNFFCESSRFLFGVSNIANPFKNFNVGPVRPIDFILE